MSICLTLWVNLYKKPSWERGGGCVRVCEREREREGENLFDFLEGKPAPNVAII